MDLKKAAALAKKYADVKGADHGFNLVALSPGWLVAGNAERGVRVPCEEIEVQAVVDAVKLLDMIRKTPGKIKLRTVATTLHIEGSGVAFQLRGKGKLPRQPEPPARWTTIEAPAVRALAAVAALAGSDFPSGAVRLTASWAAIAHHNAVAVAWVPGLTKTPVSVPGKWWSKLKGTQNIGQSGGRVWLRDDDGVSLWVSSLVGAWPDSVVDHTITASRELPGRTVFEIDGKALFTLTERAFAAADSKADAYELTWTGSQLGIKGGGDRGAFLGGIEVGPGGDNRCIGIEPKHLGGYIKAVAQAAGSEPIYFSLGGADEPLMAWCVGPVALEVLVLPVFLAQT